ncbi:MAG: universal stress protein [Bacteroidia bacterium]
MHAKNSVIKKILVPTDFSPKADRALEIACELARTTRCEITILHVLELPYSTELRKEKLRVELEKAAKPALKDAVKKAKSAVARLKVKVDHLMIVGNPIHAIVHEASKGKYDLICMGNRITSGLRRLVFDNTTSGVIDLTPIPVLATTNKLPTVDLSRMMFGTDFRQGDLQIINRISKLAAELKSHLDVVHISKRKTFDDELRMAGFEAISRKLNSYPQVDFHQFFNAEVDSGIERAVAEIKAGLIILSREHRSVLDAIFGSNVIDDLVYKTEIPVLIFPIAQQPVV